MEDTNLRSETVEDTNARSETVEDTNARYSCSCDLLRDFREDGMERWKAQSTDDLCKTLPEMATSISEHRCSCGKHIKTADNPVKRLIGFTCGCGQEWFIRLTDGRTKPGDADRPEWYEDWGHGGHLIREAIVNRL